jgi:hypothetical protein
MGQMLGRANTSTSLDHGNPTVESVAKRKFRMFPAKTDPWLAADKDSGDPSRTQSNASLDASLLPFPGDSQTASRFGWPSVSLFGSNTTDSLPLQSSSNLVGTDWSHAGSGRLGIGSRLHSRTSSAVMGTPTSGLALGHTMDDADLLMPSPQAPIGTRPQSAHVHSGSLSGILAAADLQHLNSSTPPRLNPTAPAFRLFGSAAPGGPTSTKRSILRPKPLTPSNKKIEDALDSPLPPLDSPLTSSSRRSRDGAASLASSIADDTAGRESMDSAGKEGRESFMQKVARKSSQSLGTLTSLPGRKSAKGKAKAPKSVEEESSGPLLMVETASDDEEMREDKTAVGSPAGKSFRFRSLRRRKDRTSIIPTATDVNDGEEEDLVED